jgi:hypothetical protein
VGVSVMIGEQRSHGRRRKAAWRRSVALSGLFVVGANLLSCDYSPCHVDSLSLHHLRSYQRLNEQGSLVDLSAHRPRLRWNWLRVFDLDRLFVTKGKCSESEKRRVRETERERDRRCHSYRSSGRFMDVKIDIPLHRLDAHLRGSQQERQGSHIGQ